RGVHLIVREVAVDLDLTSLRDPGRVIPLGAHPPAGPVVIVRPGDHESAGPVHPHLGELLVARSGGVDAELVAQGDTAGAEPTSVHPPAAAVLVVARPGDDEVTAAVHRDRGIILVVRGVLVDLDLAGQGDPGGGVDAGPDPVAGAGVVRPGDDEVAVGGHRHRGAPLLAGGGDVDEELEALRHPLGVVALGVYAALAAVLAVAGPDDHVVAAGVHRH